MKVEINNCRQSHEREDERSRRRRLDDLESFAVLAWCGYSQLTKLKCWRN